MARKKRYKPRTPDERFARRLGRFLKRLLAVLVLALLAAAVVWTAQRVVRFAYESDYFMLETVRIRFEGEATGKEEDVERFLRGKIEREGFLGGNLLRIDSEAVRRAALAVPRVREARVRKDYPNALDVDVRQRRGAALLLPEPIALVDAEGVVLETATTRDAAILSQPFITGVTAPRRRPGDRIDDESLTRALRLLSSLKERARSLALDLSEIHCGDDRSLTLVLKGGTEIRFGTSDPIRKMPLLETFMRRRGGLRQCAYVDLRFENQVVWKDREDAALRTDSHDAER